MVAIEPVQPIIPRNMIFITASAIGPSIPPRAFDRSWDVAMPTTDMSIKAAMMNVRISNTRPVAIKMYATSSGFSIFMLYTVML